jgi:hypothetical protein
MWHVRVVVFYTRAFCHGRRRRWDSDASLVGNTLKLGTRMVSHESSPYITSEFIGKTYRSSTTASRFTSSFSPPHSLRNTGLVNVVHWREPLRLCLAAPVFWVQPRRRPLMSLAQHLGFFGFQRKEILRVGKCCFSLLKGKVYSSYWKESVPL